MQVVKLQVTAQQTSIEPIKFPYNCQEKWHTKTGVNHTQILTSQQELQLTHNEKSVMR